MSLLPPPPPPLPKSPISHILFELKATSVSKAKQYKIDAMPDIPQCFRVVDSEGKEVATGFRLKETAEGFKDLTIKHRKFPTSEDLAATVVKHLTPEESMRLSSSPMGTLENPSPSPSSTPSLSMGPLGSNSGGSGGPLTDRTLLSFTSDGYTSEYHLYAAGLNWTKPVGLLLYTDGSGEYGLKNLSDSYLMAGTNGMIAVAKRNNMVLLTPFAPNKSCADGDGSCWYMGDSVGYAKWALSLVKLIYTQYPIDKTRIAVGGYSSGAQFSTEWWVPSGAAQQTMDEGVIVAISYGGVPQMTEVTYTTSFKNNVFMVWNVGSADDAYQGDGNFDAKSGYDNYTAKGFKTQLILVSGQDHDRDGQFGLVMEAQIQAHVCPPT